MVGPWRGKPHTFRALRATFGEMWLRCDSCRRFAALRVPHHLQDHDYRRVSFSCSICGGEAACTVIKPSNEAGMEDYREDERYGVLGHPERVRSDDGAPIAPDDVRARFDAAFPWFDHQRWGWQVERKPEMKFVHVDGAATGEWLPTGQIVSELELHMPGAGDAGYRQIKRWLRAEFGPLKEVPATRFALKFDMRRRDGGHNSDGMTFPKEGRTRK